MATKSRPARWAAAIEELKSVLNRIDTQDLEAAADNLVAVQEEYEQWQADMPDNLVDSPTATLLEGVVDLDLQYLAGQILDAINAAESTIEDAEGIDLPLGFGRD
jgi:hypothetical protein